MPLTKESSKGAMSTVKVNAWTISAPRYRRINDRQWLGIITVFWFKA